MHDAQWGGEESIPHLLTARSDANLTQADIVERMGTQAPAVTRIEKALALGKHSPSIATIRKYLTACGKQLVFQVKAI